MYEVTYTQSDGVSIEVTGDWRASIADNLPYLEPGDTVKVRNRDGHLVAQLRMGRAT